MDRTGVGGLTTGTVQRPQARISPSPESWTVLMSKDMKSEALGYAEGGTRRPGPKLSKFGKRILKMRCLDRGTCVPVASAPHPFP